MKFGDINLFPEFGSVTVTKKSRRIIRHYLGTDNSDSVDLGREATEIAVTLIAKSDSERITLEQILHENTERNLEFYNFLYKRVVADSNYMINPLDYRKNWWRIRVRFIALDPKPYSIETGNPLY